MPDSQSQSGLEWTIQHLGEIRSGGAAIMPDTEEFQLQKERLMHALRPPFLDGYPPGLLQRTKTRVKGWYKKTKGFFWPRSAA